VHNGKTNEQRTDENMAREFRDLEPAEMRTIVNDLRNKDQRINQKTEDDPTAHQNEVGDCCWDDAVEIEKKTGGTNRNIANIVHPENKSAIQVDVIDEIGIHDKIDCDHVVDYHFNIVWTILLLQCCDEGMKIVSQLAHIEFTQISHIGNIGEVLKNGGSILAEHEGPKLLTRENEHGNDCDNQMEDKFPALASKTLHTAFKLITVFLL